MYASQAAELRAQIDRQTKELVGFDSAIITATEALATATEAVRPNVERVAELEKLLVDEKAIVDAGQPAINAASATLSDLQSQASVIRQAIASCEEMLKQPIEPDPAPEVVTPDRVPTAALLIVIERRKLMAQLDAIRSALPEEQQREFDLYLKMPYTRRDHPLVAMVQQAFGWTDGEVDALFAEADAV